MLQGLLYGNYHQSFWYNLFLEVVFVLRHSSGGLPSFVIFFLFLFYRVYFCLNSFILLSLSIFKRFAMIIGAKRRTLSEQRTEFERADNPQSF